MCLPNTVMKFKFDGDEYPEIVRNMSDLDYYAWDYIDHEMYAVLKDGNIWSCPHMKIIGGKLRVKYINFKRIDNDQT